MEVIGVVFTYLCFLFIPVGLIIVGYVVGSRKERDHYASIEARETRFASVLTTSTKRIPEGDYLAPRMVMGSAVISIDRFKQLVAGFMMRFGGEVGTYASLIDRARREAVLRMKEAAPTADLIVNVRLETLSISQGGKEQVGSVEVLAYGTALRER